MGDSISALYLQNPELAIQLRRRRMAEQLQHAGTDASPVKHPLEAVSRVAQALLGAYAGYKSDQEVKAFGEKQSAEMSDFMKQMQPQQAAQPPMSGLPAAVAGQPMAPPSNGYAAILRAESGGRMEPGIYGDGGAAAGPGQVHRAALVDVNRAQGTNIDHATLAANPQVGAQVGEAYYNQLLQQFGGDPAKAAAAYNAGPGRVAAAIQANPQNWQAGIPEATRAYVAKVTGGAPPAAGAAPPGEANRLRALARQGLTSQNPRVRALAQGFISEADRLDGLAEQERGRAESRQNLLQDRADAQAEAARKRREGDLPTGYRVGADGKPQRMENLPEERRDPLAVIAEIGPLVASGKATPEQVTRYNAYATDYTQPRTVTNERGTFVITPQLPPGMPSPNAAPQSAGLPPGVQEYKNPDRDQPVTVATGTLANADSLRKIQAARAALDKYPQGIGPGNYVQPGPLKDWLDPGGVDMRARLADLASMTLHDRAGSAMTSQELERVKPFIPNATDTPDTARKKLEKFEEEVRNILTDQYKTFGPDAGYRRLPAVEEVLKGARKETASAPRVIQYDATGKRVAQ